METLTFPQALNQLLDISTQRQELVDELMQHSLCKSGSFQEMFDALPTPYAKVWAYKLVHGTFNADPAPIIRRLIK